MASSIPVHVVGYGRFGKEICGAVDSAEGLELASITADHARDRTFGTADDRTIQVAGRFPSSGFLWKFGEPLHVVVLALNNPIAALELVSGSASGKPSERDTRFLVCTTGFDDEQRAALAEYAQKVVVCHAPNLSPGANASILLAQVAALLVGRFGWCAHGLAIHHAQKADPVSGTLRRMKDVVGSPDCPITISGAILVGHPGRHQLFFDGEHDDIQIIHTARSLEAFTADAPWAIQWLAQQEPGELLRIEDCFFPGFLDLIANLGH